MAIATLPGATLWHEGQFEGWRVRLPVFLGRRPDEPVDDDLRQFHLALVAAAGGSIRHGRLGAVRGDAAGRATPAAPSSSPGRGPTTSQRVTRRGQRRRRACRGPVHLPWGDLAGRSWRLEDQLSGDVFERDGDELANDGLYVQLPPWGTHLLTWTASS